MKIVHSEARQGPIGVAHAVERRGGMMNKKRGFREQFRIYATKGEINFLNLEYARRNFFGSDNYEKCCTEWYPQFKEICTRFKTENPNLFLDDEGYPLSVDEDDQICAAENYVLRDFRQNPQNYSHDELICLRHVFEICDRYKYLLHELFGESELEIILESVIDAQKTLDRNRIERDGSTTILYTTVPHVVDYRYFSPLHDEIQIMKNFLEEVIDKSIGIISMAKKLAKQLSVNEFEAMNRFHGYLANLCWENCRTDEEDPRIRLMLEIDNAEYPVSYRNTGLPSRLVGLLIWDKIHKENKKFLDAAGDIFGMNLPSNIVQPLSRKNDEINMETPEVKGLYDIYRNTKSAVLSGSVQILKH